MNNSNYLVYSGLLVCFLAFPLSGVAFCTYQQSENEAFQTRIMGDGFYNTYFQSNHKQCWDNHQLRNIHIDTGFGEDGIFRNFKTIFLPFSIESHGYLLLKEYGINYEKKAINWNLSINNYDKGGNQKASLNYTCHFKPGFPFNKVTCV